MTREKVKELYDNEVKKGMYDNPLAWHIWKKAFRIFEMEKCSSSEILNELLASQEEVAIGISLVDVVRVDVVKEVFKKYGIEQDLW
jgi:hypothetical protein